MDARAFHPKILKRLLIHAAGYNLALLMRKLLGIGKPRCAQDVPGKLSQAFFALLRTCRDRLRRLWRLRRTA